MLGGVDGILVPGGFGYRGIAGKIEAIRYARERKVPFFGICLGLQCAVIEFARNVVGLDDANSTEFDRNCRHPGRLPARRAVRHHRQGRHDAAGVVPVRPRRRAARPSRRTARRWSRNAIAIATSSTTSTASSSRPTAWSSPAPARTASWSRSIELRDHPWFVAVQCHPEFKSKPTAGASAVPRLHPGQPGPTGGAEKRGQAPAARTPLEESET